jgi:tRNA threonylcarbamoyladenosine biosynthesis protein TsaB
VKTGPWLAIDTATEVMSVAVGVPPGSGAGAHVVGARRHAAEIIRLIDFSLARLGLTPEDLDGIVIADGPGSFTGLRIGWAVAKGLAQEAGLDVVAVPSLLACAASIADRLGPVPVAACYDALRGQVYGAVYRFHAERVDTLLEPTVGTVAELARLSPEKPQRVVGDGATRYEAASVAWSGAPPVPLDALPPIAPILLALLRLAGASRVIENVLTAEPVYGRPAEAQARWEAAHGRPLTVPLAAVTPIPNPPGPAR